MSKSRSKQTGGKSLANEVVAVVLVAVAVLLFLSLITYDPKDPSWNSSVPPHDPSNLIGLAGAYAGDFFLQLFGIASLIIPALLVLIAARAFFSEAAAIPLPKAFGALLLLIAFSGFLSLFPNIEIGLLANSSSNGGAVGYIIEGTLAGVMNTLGAAIVLTLASVLTLMLTMEVSLATVSHWLHSAKEARVETHKGEPTMFQRLSGWWAARAERHRQQTAEREEERRRKDEERRRKDDAARKQTAEQRRAKADEERKIPQPREDRPTRAEPVITPVITKSDVAPVIGAFEDTNEVEDEIDEPARIVSSPRREAAAALRAYTERTGKVRSAQAGSGHQAGSAQASSAQAGSAQAVAPDITLDPEVAEMISTASIVRTVPTDKLEAPAKGAKAGRAKTTDPVSNYKLPPLDILEAPVSHHEEAEEELRERATILAEKCKEFSVVGHIHRINPGPVVTTFEFKPDPGIKYSRVVGLAEDLCLALKAESIRIDRIPGKSTVGIEVPNAHREKIFLRDIIESPRFVQSESKLTIALGKTINGEEYIADLSKMPHMLIAGATGAGKSVTLNALICSILYKASPDEVKFIMVDPKRVELGLYENIPHLLTPIVTDPKRASNALKWAVNEMENRYRELATLGVRNIEQYNRQVRELTHPTLSEDNPTAPKPLPYIVIAIDELADLMMVARSEVETSIARLAQMARAVGIHLVLATQRPSVDIITGVIKANIPSRIAFRVSSKVDSRTIIDSNGAEALLGQGDMLFLPPASARLIRVHGSFVNETEVKSITDHTRKQAEPDYNEQVTQGEQEGEEADGFAGEQDELYEDALAIVIAMGRASTSVLQRRLSIGYGRAAKILDMMERQGFIGPAEGAKPRKVLSAAYEFRERLEQRIEDRAE